ncbi:hypothetical protein ZWY2020_022913 [Hordeum vulgare]|nr:hypothetical protein ZWY2020_022913 [Hordeum vulgare]
MMARPFVLLCVLLAVVVTAAASAAREKEEEPSAYIVHVAHAHAPPLPRRGLLSTRAYASFLRDHVPVDMSLPAPRVLYSYSHAATGFAARLTGRQAAHLTSQRSVLAVVPDVMQQLHTTLTPSFLGLSASSGLLPASNGASDVVIGVLDTGVYPIDRAAFAADPSLPPPPGKFRGACVSTPSFNASAYCNGKLVGAKVFYKGYEVNLGGPINETEESKSPLDTVGHGTHTASTAAGSAVPDAAFYGYARGNAVGMAPGARIASYKVCWKYGCPSSDILAAFDEAIADGVDVISASLGSSGYAEPFYMDSTAVGAFSAVRKGIIVSAAAGNSGPVESTANNIAPWFLTVGASTINRRFPADVVLGNGDTFSGASLYAGPPLGPTAIPLVDGRAVGSKTCEAGKMNASLVAGKIVLCGPAVLNAAQGEAVKLAGGVGAILTSTKQFGELAVGSPHTFPATTVTFAAAKRIKTYMNKTTSPAATIVFHGTVIGPTPSSPRMAPFSSRGPNLHAPEILKPDVTAPGVEILAAWTGAASPSGLDSDRRRVHYNVLSGTSMACPHVSGIAAMLRQARPGWSPAAIKSALMTTAYNVDSAGNVIGDMATGKASTPFARGAGHVDPDRALDPGLVYDASTDDYVAFLCALGYTADEVAVFTRDGSSTNCSAAPGSAYVGDHNYPAFVAVLTSRNGTITQRRVVRNVGSDVVATYRATVTSPAGMRITVKPRKLRFSKTHKTQEYQVTFAIRAAGSIKEYTFGSIVWSDGKHKVTSPIAIAWSPPASEIAAL